MSEDAHTLHGDRPYEVRRIVVERCLVDVRGWGMIGEWRECSFEEGQAWMRDVQARYQGLELEVRSRSRVDEGTPVIKFRPGPRP